MLAGSRTRTLRAEVAIEDDGASTSISFAHWQVCVPNQTICGDVSLVEFLSSRRLEPKHLGQEASGLFTLLEAQGCFLPDFPAKLTARELLRLFQPLRSQLYAQYYSHPIWSRLRSGKASRGELTAWMIHNYHVSRSAGVIAARMAVRSPDPILKAFFREDSLEEYWHCDAFYFVEKSGVNLPANGVKDYVPLPASCAFEDHALRVAEEDAIGHLLIAYFQESSIIFRRDSERFYDAVEANYGLKDAFKGWRKHMTLDLDHDHAGALERCFDAEREITLDQAKASLRTVQLAHFFLLKALDQIAEHADVDNAIMLRMPKKLPSAPHYFEPIIIGLPLALHLFDALREAAFRALAFARTHDQIISNGRLATRLNSVPCAPDSNGRGPWLVACRNFLLERAIDPDVVTALAPLVCQLIAGACPQLADVVTVVSLTDDATNSCDRRTKTVFFRLRELIVLAATDDDLPALTLM